MVAHPPANPIPGEWYLGWPCSHCDEMVLFLLDITGGKGDISVEVTENELGCLCVRGHLTSFRPDEQRQFRWWPQYSS